MPTHHLPKPFPMLVALSTFFSLFPGIRTTTVTVHNPLDNQLPTLARVNKYWTWAPSPDTFYAPGDGLKYTASGLPRWMAFDEWSFMFAGTPSEQDEGCEDVTLTARGSSASASSRVTFCVSRNPLPLPRLSIATQFSPENPSISSAYFLSPGSSLTASSEPCLRIPSKWSFSIGFEYNTFDHDPGDPSTGDFHYAVKQVNGSALPDWMAFNTGELTLNGVTPSDKDLPTPATFHLGLYASEQEGYSAVSMPFCVVVASHELSAASSMPTVNITAGVPFKIDLNSPADFSGIFLDNKPIHAQNISNLTIDVSGYDGWLLYNPVNRTLSGDPKPELAGQKLTLPVAISTPFNQGIRTNVSVAIVPSYFTDGDFSTIYAAPGDKISFSLSRYFSNSSFEQSGDLDLSMIYEPTDVESFLSLSGGSVLEGTVPEDFPTVHILVTFTAFSRVTHSTSHASLPIFVTASESQDRTPKGRWGGLSGNQHSRLVLALAVIFGILGGLCLVGGILAIVRRMARVEDTALTGEEGRNAWSDKDRKWYGLDGTPTRRSKWAGLSPKHSPLDEKMGLGLRRVPERSAQNQAGSLSAQSSGVLSKREFFAKLKQTVRYVSDKYSPNRKPFGSDGLTPHIIERPIIVRTKTAPPTVESLPFEHVVDAYAAKPFGLASNAGSANLSHSSSSSTAEYSIPQRRRDFGKPKGKTQVHFDEGTSDYRTRINNHELKRSIGQYLRPGSRTSLRSNKSATVFSQDSPLVGVITDVSPTSPAPATLRPRLVPFTSATLVPAPSSSPNSGTNATGFPAVNNLFAGGQRIASQKAKIVRIPESGGGGDGMKKSGSGDELRVGLQYVQALGADNQPGAVASPGATSKMRSSFSSLESSNAGHNGPLGTPTEQRVLVAPGQKFRFLVRIPPVSIAARAQGVTTSTPVMLPREYNVKIISGQPLSQLHVDLNGIETRGTAEVTGESTREDIGVVSFGIYAGRKNEVCLAMVIVEVAETR